MSPNEKLAQQAERFDRIASELEVAARHAGVAANHFRNGDVAPAGAHVFAMMGHQANAKEIFNEAASIHAAHSNINNRQA